jgi:hypothetical protein
MFGYMRGFLKEHISNTQSASETERLYRIAAGDENSFTLFTLTQSK